MTTTELALLPVAERAANVLKFDERKAELAALVKQSERIVTITNRAGRDECHAALMDLSNARIGIQKNGKDAREDATAFSKAVIAKEKELIEVLSPEETRLRELRDAWDAEREAERVARVRAEEERIAALERERLATIQAETDRINREREAALVAERAEIDRQRAELEAAQKVEADRLRAEREAHEASLAAERKRIVDERAELDRQQAAMRRAAQEEADHKAQAERNRLDAEASAERERIAKELEAARLKRLDALRANAPELRVAAISAHHLLVEHGLGDNEITLQLGLAIESGAKTVKRRVA